MLQNTEKKRKATIKNSIETYIGSVSRNDIGDYKAFKELLIAILTLF